MRPALSGSGVASVSGSMQVHGIYIKGRQINDDNDDQGVNSTNADPVPPSASGRLEEGVNQR